MRIVIEIGRKQSKLDEYIQRITEGYILNQKQKKEVEELAEQEAAVKKGVKKLVWLRG